MRESCSPSDQILYNVITVQKELSQLFDTEMDGLSLTRYDILSNLNHVGPLRQRELQQRVDVDHAAITRHLKQLETQGLIARERCLQDNRVIYVDLTELGRDKIAHWTEQKKCLSDRLFVNMKVEEQQHLLDLLNTLQHNIQHERKTLI
ncbi:MULTISPECIES: MarR family winged helix-turn-helix transcriptional regulator [Exiguobacterium]|uniref:MarR family winged helix-turn-helix transcriptional regulator n=1 Tax=Exiguobacterium TaxID=33986 RepID=UPI0008779EE8|nr:MULTISPECIES: MarR family transcriptional regulator [Exiguobacterium]OGX78964.1 transcriptional regulator [Exiguobacterium sp. SH31]TCI25834.1 MarR family transcriptional regulator [Exiguobacterium sp. SH5S4]TCI34478.1 MarR family transcriptional regulator [Exiguobacterium sp. SH4S7]TCI44231.1 MarR family transcriptional regulator [Exiguobacterium sp. SH5S32]TCI50497.1 MarR family transcriptional regulator [Exiguobacterium sp. SH1S4]